MQIPEEVILTAIEGGWRPKEWPLSEEPSEEIVVGIVEPTDDDPYPIRFSNREYPEEGYYYSTDAEHIVLDPKFFQALGKALGSAHWKVDFLTYRDERGDIHKMRRLHHTEEWLYHALRYHELALTDGDTEKFWKDLLNH